MQNDSQWLSVAIRTLNLTLIALLIFLRLYRSPASAASLETVPDSVEYVAGAEHLLHQGTFAIAFNGKSYPSRYSPWFSAFILAPLQKIAPGRPGIGILFVLFTSVVTLWVAALVARTIASPGAGALTILLLLFNPAFVYSSRTIMTDIPVVMCGTMLLLLFIRSGRDMNWPALLAAGLLIAISMALRPVSYFFAIPFLYRLLTSSNRLKGAIALLVAPVAITVASAYYNWHTFGQVSRTGYSYWCAVPYDFFWLTFNPRYAPTGLKLLLINSNAVRFPFAIAVVCLLLVRPVTVSDSFRKFAIFAASTAVPLTLFYFLYFYSDIRFHLLLVVCGCILAAAMLAALFSPLFDRHSAFIPCVLAVAVMMSVPRDKQYWDAYRYPAVQAFDRLTPKDAVLISSMDPVYLNMLYQKQTDRFILPMTRTSEYASKLVAPRKITHVDPPPTGPLDTRAAGLFKQGAYDSVPQTADEEWDQIQQWVEQGRPVYLDLNVTDQAVTDFIQEARQRFRLKISPEYPQLAKLQPLEDRSTATTRPLAR